MIDSDFYFPSAIEWMWNYCVSLGKYTDSKGDNYDLGVFIEDNGRYISNAIVYGDEPGQYISGWIYPTVDFSLNERTLETIKRAKEKNLIPKDYQPIER